MARTWSGIRNKVHGLVTIGHNHLRDSFLNKRTKIHSQRWVGPPITYCCFSNSYLKLCKFSSYADMIVSIHYCQSSVKQGEHGGWLFKALLIFCIAFFTHPRIESAKWENWADRGLMQEYGRKCILSSLFQHSVIDQQLVNIWLKNPIIPFISVTSSLYRMSYIQMW